jgi:ribonuclease-3
MTEETAIGDVARALGHRFDRAELLRDALTHRSFANEQARLAPVDNERLEFLGDAALELVTSLLLWEAFPDASEGELTRRRADLVCEASLAEVARELGIGAALRLGRGEERSGGRDKPRLLASAFEACMGALVLDAGVDTALRVGRAVFESRIHASAPGATDYKSRAQEIAQSQGLGTPSYPLLGMEGPDHERRFHVAFVVADRTLAEGEGRSKLEAEQAAAAAALAHLPTTAGSSPGEGLDPTS